MAVKQHLENFDPIFGGLGDAPKFLHPAELDLLLRRSQATDNKQAAHVVNFTLQQMAHGGLYDQLGGGFCRYSVDERWDIPHFEKMLYDNAQLVRVYLHLFQITKDEFFKRITVETLEYIKREMLHEKGGFFSAQDADSEGVEGKFFVWTPNEIEELLGAGDAQIFNFYYDVSEDGNFEEKNILNIKNSLTETEEVFKISLEKLQEILEQGREKLFNEREKRIKPFRDEKVLTAWNGLMLAAFADAARVLDDDNYLEIAKRNAEFICTNLMTGDSALTSCGPLQNPGRLLRTWKDGKAKLNGYVEDYANVADALVELYQATGEIDYIVEAKRLADAMITEFWDDESGGFFFTSNDHEELIVRNKDFYDNATPSGNSVAADVLLKLAKFTGDERSERFAIATLRLAASQISRHPQGFGRALSALEFHLGETKEVVVVGEKGNELEREIHGKYLPDAIVIMSSEPESHSKMIPLLKDRGIIDGKATAYVCENFVCQRPVTSIDDLRLQV